MKEKKEEDINRIVSENLIRLRNEKKYSQKKIAEVLSIKQPSYNRMESGETKIGLEKLHQLAKFYRVSIVRFLKNQPRLRTRIPRGDGRIKGNASSEAVTGLLFFSLFMLFLMLYIFRLL